MMRRLLVLVVVASCAKKAGPPCERTKQSAIEGIELARAATKIAMEKLERQATQLAMARHDVDGAPDALRTALAELARTYGCGDALVCCAKLPSLDGLPGALAGVHANFDGRDAFEAAATTLVKRAHTKQAGEACKAVVAALEHVSHAGADELASRVRDTAAHTLQVSTGIDAYRGRLVELDQWRSAVIAGTAAKIGPAPLPDEPPEVVAARTLVVQCAAACSE